MFNKLKEIEENKKKAAIYDDLIKFIKMEYDASTTVLNQYFESKNEILLVSILRYHSSKKTLKSVMDTANFSARNYGLEQPFKEET